MRHHHRVPILLASCIGIATTAIEYGVDTSFPMHHDRVSTNYPWLPHNVAADNHGHNTTTTITSATPKEYETMPLQPLGNKQGFYEQFVKGCVNFYKQVNREQDCLDSEDNRIRRSFQQPRGVQNYTKVGYIKLKAPKALFQRVRAFWEANRHRQTLENWDYGVASVNHWESPTYMLPVENEKLVGGGPSLQQDIWNATHDMLVEWTGHSNLADCSLYGIRVYKEGSILAPHVDRLPLVTSAILNVDQDVDEPWPLEVIGRDGIAVNVTMEPGDMVLYESHSIIHGRPFPLKGSFMANVFIHFEPAPLNDDVTSSSGSGSDLPIYIAPGAQDERIWKDLYPNWKSAPIRHVETLLAAKEGDSEFISKLYQRDKSILFAVDDNGWQPLHEAIRHGHLDTVKVLIDLGANVNARTKRHKVTNEGGSPLYWAERFLGESHPIVDLLREHKARMIKPGATFSDEL